MHHRDISLGNLVFYDRRKVEVHNDFDLARFEDWAGASGQENIGTLPFMALDLRSEKGLRGEIPRRYRDGAESFVWFLICLCLAAVVIENDRSFTVTPWVVWTLEELL
jgi:hypothetical protein